MVSSWIDVYFFKKRTDLLKSYICPFLFHRTNDSREKVKWFPLESTYIFPEKKKKISVNIRISVKDGRANRGKLEERRPTAPSSGCRDDRFASPTDQGLLVSSARHRTRVDHAGRDASSRGGAVKKVNIPLCHRWHAEFRVATIQRTLRHALGRRVSDSPRRYSTSNIYSR